MKRLIITVTCLFLMSCSGPEPVPDDWTLEQRLADIDRLLGEWEQDGASGQVYLALHEQTIYSKGFGSASCAMQEPVTPAHHFMIGSITKEITQLLAHVLQERGLLSLDDTVAHYFPQIENGIAEVTLQQLIDHTAGLPDLIDENGRPVRYRVAYDYEPVSRAQLIERLSRTSLQREPGSREEYSNLGYQLLAAIFEVAADDSYENLLRRAIFQPAGMSDTEYWFDDNAAREFADGCDGNDHWGNPIDDGMWGPDGASWNLKGAGGLIATGESLCRFFQGIGNGVYFQDEAAAEGYRTARMPFSQSRNQRTMGPAGSNGIFNAVAVWFDSDRLCLTMFTNRSRFQAENGMVQEIIRLFPPPFMTTL